MEQTTIDDSPKIERKTAEIEGFYNTDKIERYAPDANIVFVVGARRIGKTLHFQKKAFQEIWEKDGLQTMWLRNKKVELSDPSFANDFLNAPKTFGWCDEDCVAKSDGVWLGEDQIVKFQSISTFSNRRGNMTKDVGMIVFDEFMPEDRRYPQRCHIGLLSLTKTVLSGREDAKCYCLSNFISAANPYFVGFGIYPRKELDVTNFKDKGLAIEVCRGYRSAIAANNKWNRVYKAGGYQDYADETEDSLFSLICPVPKGGKLFNIFIVNNGKTYGATVKDGLMYWHENQPNNTNVFAANLQECSDAVSLVPKFFVKMLKEWTEANVLRFKDANTMYVILSILFNAI